MIHADLMPGDGPAQGWPYPGTVGDPDAFFFLQENELFLRSAYEVYLWHHNFIILNG
jgi:hypothetical protein